MANPVCVRLPDDLDVALRQRAEAEGLSVSELLISMLSHWVYGSTPSVDEGYKQARSLATKLAHEAVSRAIDDLPSTYEEAISSVAYGNPNPNRRRKG